MLFNKWLVIILLILMVLVSGCVSEKEFLDARLTCLELTSESYAFVPVCDSTENCFQEAQEILFDFPENVFHSSVRKELFDYKNNVARSWFYFNNARNKIREIHSMCENSNISNLPEKASELNSNLVLAFEEADNANKKAAKILFIENSLLNDENINLIKEEPLFDSFILINSNLNQLESKSVEQNGSFASNYMLAVNEFSQLAESKGFEKIVLSPSTPLDFLDVSNSRIPEHLLKKEIKKEEQFFIPLIADSFKSMLGKVNNLFKAEYSVEAIKKFPSKEFMLLYSKSAGKENSVFEDFSVLIKKDANSRKTILETNNKLIQELETKTNELNQKLKDLQLINSFNDVQELKSLLNSEESQSQTEFISSSSKTEGFDSFRLNSLTKINLIKTQLIELKNRKETSNISEFELLSKLKQFNVELIQLEQQSIMFQKEFFDSPKEQCVSQAELISQKLESKEFNSITLFTLAQSILNEINLFNNSNLLSEQFSKCKSFIQKYNSLKELESEENLIERNTSSEIESCLLEADSVSDFLQDSLFSERLLALKEFAKNPLNKIQALDECKSLIKEGTSISELSEDFIEAEQKFLIAIDLLDKIRLFNAFYPEIITFNKVNQSENKFNEFNVFFKDEKINPLSNPGSSIELIQKITNFNNESIKIISEAFSEFIKQSIKEEITPTTPIIINSESNAIELISFNNTLFDFSFPSSFLIEKQSRKKTANSSPNVSAVVENNTNFEISLSTIPLGETFIEFQKPFKIQLLEKYKVLSSTSNKAVIKKSIEFESIEKIKESFLLVDLPERRLLKEETKAILDSKELEFSFEKNQVKITLPEIQGKKIIDVFFSISNPLTISLNQTNESKENETDKTLAYEVSITSNLSFDLKNTLVLLPLNMPKNMTISTKLVNSQGKIIDLMHSESGNLSFLIKDMLKFSDWDGQLEITVLDIKETFNEIIKETKNLIDLLKSSDFTEIRTKANAFEKQLLLIQSIEQSKQNLEKLTMLKTDVVSLQLNEKSLIDLKFTFEELRKKSIEKINDLKQSIVIANNFSLNEKSELKSMLDSCTQLISEADVFASRQNYKQAILKLQEISLITQKRILINETINDFIENKNSKLFELKKMFSLLKINQNKKINEIASLLKNAENNFNSANYVKAKELFDISETMINELDLLLEQSLTNKLNEFNLLKESFSKKESFVLIEFLEKQFDSVSEKELIQAKVSLPFNKKEINQIKEKLESLPSKTLQKSINKIDSFFSQLDFEKALIELNKSELGIQRNLKEIQIMKQRLNEMKSFLETKAKDNLALLSSEDVEKAVKLIDDKQLLKSIIFSSKATMLATLPDENENLGLFALIPVILGALFYVFYKKRTQKKKPKPVFRKIEKPQLV